MITTYFPLGKVSFSNEYFSALVGEAAKNCFGVAGMSTGSVKDSVMTLVLGEDFPEKGVRVTAHDNMLYIELHIAVSYGVNVSSAAQSISHRVRDEVEQATGLKVARVEVCVDDIIE